MPSPSSSADKRALLSPSTVSTLTAHNPSTSTIATTSSSTEASPPSSTETSAWTRPLESPTRASAHASPTWKTVDRFEPIAAGNGGVTADVLQHRHAHVGEAMAGRRSSYPFSSLSPAADPASRFFALQHTTDGVSGAQHERLPAGSVVANGATHGDEQNSIVHDSNLSPQKQLNEYRDKLTRDLEQRELSTRGLHAGQPDRARILPIQEEAASNSSFISSAFPTASTESGHTIRGGSTPAPVVGTPSYPFPRVTMPPNSFVPPQFSGTSRTPMLFEYRGVLDRVLSENSTPASTFTFNPGGTPQPENFDYPTPNLFDLSLMLSAEPGLDAWWNTVVQVMREVYKAERVTLAVPADTTDLENVPWGQKATYNEHEEDDLSLGYMAKGASTMQSGDNENPDVVAEPDDGTAPNAPPKRPGFPSRHSFTSYEDNKERSQEKSATASRRPDPPMRSKTHFSSLPTASKLANDRTQLNKDALEEHDNFEEERQQHIPSWEAPFTSPYEGQGRVLPVLQALDYEADPLIDHTGVMRILERGRPVALTRTYPYLATTNPTNASGNQSSGQKPASRTVSGELPKKAKKQRSDSITKLSCIFAGPTGARGSARGKVHFGDHHLDEGPRPQTPKYEEYEQTPPSPWAQSPAPSPAVRPDPKENPFFTDAMVDEESFNPGPVPTDYTAIRPPEAIGVDHSWTVLHIPLTHVLLSKPPRPFKLNAAAMQQKSQSRGSESDAKQAVESERRDLASQRQDRPAPIAILSILSPIIPYPSNLRHSLDHLAPHLATSFSLCRHYSNLETELAGLKRRRPSTAGFGAVSAYGRPIDSAAYLADDGALQQSLAGSITSPSDYSGISKSATGSPIGTPVWDSGSIAYLIDRRQPVASPAAVSQISGSYFGSKQALSSTRQELLNSGSQRPRTEPKDTPPGEIRLSHLPSNKSLQSAADIDESAEKPPRNSEDVSSKDANHRNSLEGTVYSADQKLVNRPTESSRLEQDQPRRGHTLLHSYGADFNTTFQSLPSSSTLLSRPASTPTVSTPQRSGSFTTAAVDMPPPSDRLKGLILDSLPAHVFVALPQTGEIVWVNSRYLSYRGQTVADLSADPWGSIHPDERDDYLKAWSHSLRTGEQFSSTVRIKRFDGAYRWFYARAVASKDKRGVIMQFLGSYLDIHDQRMAEIKAARQQEVEASEAKHRLLANLIPQIIFTATEDDGVTFANEQWLSYTGQSFEDALRLGFLDFVHPEDLAKCRLPVTQSTTPSHQSQESDSKVHEGSGPSSDTTTTPTEVAKDQFAQVVDSPSSQRTFKPEDSSSSSPGYELANADLAELARKGVIKVATDTNGRVSYTTEVRLRSKTGEYRWHLVRCVEIDTIDFGSGASSYFGSATDINDHKLLETKLKEAMESKSRFLSNMSHEIRTPLIGISGMVSFLQDTTLNEEQRDYTNTIQTSANSLIMIINDILDLSKVDAGMMKLKHQWFHTRSLIEDVNELVSTMAIAKRLELNYLVDADVPAWVKGDKVRIRQVLLNVIGNAIKFTSIGEVFSRCRVKIGDGSVMDENEILLEFTVTDTGRGFSEEEKALIFKPFSQIDESSTRQHGGSGLGLVISRQLVELHGGKMEGTAVVGKGSTFTFTARFTLPTTEDRPSLLDSPGSKASPETTSAQETEHVPADMKALPPPEHIISTDEGSSGATDTVFTSPGVDSIASSDQSVHSGRSHITDETSVASATTELTLFSQAIKATGQDVSQMNLEIPSDENSVGRTATPEQRLSERPRPSMYSILIICPQYHSREATTQHIEMTLPKDVPHQITALGTVEEAEQLVGGDNPMKFTHIVINLGSAKAIISLMDQITKSHTLDITTILILSDSVQRQTVLKCAVGTKYERLLSEHLVTFIYKPVKPSRFAVIFDPDKVRDLSTDWNRSTAQKMVENQKASYLEIERRMGNRGFKVLLVEDNPVNQKVLTKYLKKIGVNVEIAVDGVECTDQVLSKPHQYYSLILCDLHMPRKDGYQACREIREWERVDHCPRMPIIALSANVMSDVQEKCVAAGFSDYITKPVDFIDLSSAMARFF